MLWKILIGIIVLFIIFSKTPKGKGILGEWRVRMALGKTREGKKYVINDLTVCDETGMSHQIDHIVINKNGVFVIETKNYSGRICGNDSSQEWTQTLAYGKVKNKFRNPVKQNATHIYQINRIIKRSAPVFSIVVFVRANTTFVNSYNVFTIREMKGRLKEKLPNNLELSEAKIEETYNAIMGAKAKVSKRQHVKNINQMVENVGNGICPRCGGKLVKRNGKYGEFIGCSNHPRCTFIKK